MNSKLLDISGVLKLCPYTLLLGHPFLKQPLVLLTSHFPKAIAIREKHPDFTVQGEVAIARTYFRFMVSRLSAPVSWH